MKQARKVLCIISVGIIGVLLAVSTVYACCGMFPEITDDPIEPGCPGDEVTISGTISAEDTWKVADGSSYSIDAWVIIEVESPSGDVTTIELTPENGGLFSLVQVPDPPDPPGGTATYDFSATYTPTEAGTYTYVKTVYWQTSAWPTPETASESGTFVVPLCVDIDIKPCSLPNSINLKSKGVTPVAILTTADFDATTVDPSTVELGGVPPLRWAVEDVGEGKDCVGDGDLDLILHFSTPALREDNGGPLNGSSTEATLTGETLDGDPIQGTDSVRIVKY